MELAELVDQCNAIIARGGRALLLVLPGEPGRNAYSRRLCGKQGPRGEIINVNSEGNTVCRFDASAVLKFIERESK